MKKKKRPTSVRLPEELDEYLAAAMKATGSSASDLIVACVKESLDPVVDRIIKRNRNALAKLEDIRRQRSNKRICDSI